MNEMFVRVMSQWYYLNNIQANCNNFILTQVFQGL
jgi:hypothetical protein